jgi:hypothetical protein
MENGNWKMAIGKSIDNGFPKSSYLPFAIFYFPFSKRMKSLALRTALTSRFAPELRSGCVLLDANNCEIHHSSSWGVPMIGRLPNDARKA